MVQEHQSDSPEPYQWPEEVPFNPDEFVSAMAYAERNCLEDVAEVLDEVLRQALETPGEHTLLMCQLLSRHELSSLRLTAALGLQALLGADRAIAKDTWPLLLADEDHRTSQAAAEQLDQCAKLGLLAAHELVELLQ